MYRDDDVVVLPPHCPDCGSPFRAAMAETTRYYVCPCCGLVRLVPFRAIDPAVPPLRAASRVVAR